MSDKIKSVDLLNRQEFVDRVIRIIELQSVQKKTSCFAINGKWGVGKSFVLNMLEELLDVRYDEFLLFHYNCWQYDYYDEPLVAIVSSMLDTIDEKENLIPSDAKAKIKGFLKAVGSALLVKANEAIEKKTGFNPQEIIDVITDATERSAEKIEEEHRYDSNFIFKATLKRLQETIRDLANDKTIIFVVDELDRCLPEYAIKILERLHHVFADIPNVQVILSIDKSQLEHIIKKTFGENTETQKYLSKFINFEVNLDEGSFSDDTEFDNKFAFYLQKFKYLNDDTKPYQVNEFKTRIFDGIDMRSRIEIIDKCDLVHSLLNKDDAMFDYTYMCLELLCGIFDYLKISVEFDKRNLIVPVTTGISYLCDVYMERQKSGSLYYNYYDGISFYRVDDIFGVMVAWIANREKNLRVSYTNDSHKIRDIFKYLDSFEDLLRIVN